MKKKLTQKEFIDRSLIIHNNAYDYSLVEYDNNKIKVRIICFKHGEFWQSPSKHLKGQGCPICAIDKITDNTNIFINKSKLIHGEKYDYSLINYKNSKINIRIICFEHGEFWQTPSNHLSGHGCPKCGGRYKLTTLKFIEKSIKIHDNKYNYSEVLYINNKTKVKIKCPKHGTFTQRPDAHLRGQGCPKCR